MFAWDILGELGLSDYNQIGFLQSVLSGGGHSFEGSNILTINAAEGLLCDNLTLIFSSFATIHSS